MKKNRLLKVFSLSGALLLGSSMLISCQPDTPVITENQITISGATSTINIGESITLTALANENILTGVKWSSSNKSAIIIDSATGEVNAIGLGTAEITASKEGYTAGTVTITVIDPTLKTMTITASSNTVETGKNLQLSANENGSVITPDSWTSSNTNVGVISTTGLFRANAVGTTTITALKEGYNPATYTITVTQGTTEDTTYIITYVAYSGVTYNTTTTEAKAGETVTFTLSVIEGMEIVSVTYNGNPITPNDSTYSFIMPSTDVEVRVTASFDSDVSISGDLALSLTDDNGDGIYEGSAQVLNDSQLIYMVKDGAGGYLEVNFQDFDTYKCFGDIETATDYHNYQFEIKGGYTYTFYYDSNATTKPFYIRRTNVDTLPQNETQFASLFDAGDNQLTVYPQDVKKVTYHDAVGHTNYEFNKYANNTTIARATDTSTQEETGLVYKKLEGENLQIVDTYIESATDATARSDTSAFSANVKVYEHESEAATSPWGNYYSSEGWGSNGQGGWETWTREAEFDANYYSHNYNSLEFEFMYAYRTGFQDDNMQSYDIDVTSVGNDDGTFTTTIDSSKTLVNTSENLYEHYEYDLIITFTKEGKITTGTFTTKLYGTSDYNFTEGSEGFLPGGENRGTTTEDITFTYEYGTDLETAPTIDVSQYFISSLTSVRINNDDLNTDTSKNVLQKGDDISTSAGTLDLEYQPTTALDYEQYDVINVTDNGVIAPSNDIDIYEAKNFGTSTVTIGNRTTNTVTANVEVTVEDSTPARDFYFDGSWSGLTENIIVDTAESITINDNTTGKVSFKVTPAQANNEDLTFHVSEPYQNLVELTYDSSTSILTVKTGVFTQKATVTFTVESPHLDPEVSTPTFTINVNPSSSVTIDSLFGTYSQSEEQDSLISKNSAHKVTLTSETGQQDGYTWYIGTVTDGTVTKEFYYRLDEGNQLVATIIGDSYTDEGYESVRIMYDYETGEIGLIYWIEVWGGLDSVTTTYIVGNDDGDYDYLTYIYEMFTKDIA